MDDFLVGDEDVHEAVVLVEELGNIPMSRYAAKVAGGIGFLGWDETRQILADMHDTILALAAALSGEKLTADDLWPRPQREELEVGTIADWNVGAFMRQLSS